MSGEAGRAGAPVVVALALVVIVLPFGAGFPLTDDPYPQLRAVPWLDLALIGLIGAVAPLTYRRIRSRRVGAGATLWSSVVVLLAISFALQPSLIGAQTMIRLVGVLAVAVALAALVEDERTVAAAVVAGVVCFEVLVAAAQLAAGGPIGVLGEVPDPLSRQHGIPLPRGTLSHSYVLAGLGAVAAMLLAERALASPSALTWRILAGIAAVPTGLSCSRSALLGFASACAALGAGWRDAPVRWLVVALLAGAATAALVQRDGWVGRAEEGVDLRSRTRLIDQAVILVGEHPLLGVGPGRYVAAARERFPDAPFTQSVHDVPLQIAVEGGIPAGVLSGALVAVLGLRSLRGGPHGLALFLAFAPFVVADVFPYVAAQGTVLLGLWIGGLDRAASSPAQWRTRSARPVRDERRMASASSSVRSASSPVTTGARRP